MLDTVTLDDLTADRYLLDAQGISLLVFYNQSCGNCRQVRQQLPSFNLFVERVVWIDTEHSRGLIERYEVFHFPSLFVVKDGVFYGEITPHLNAIDIGRELQLALDSYPAELP